MTAKIEKKLIVIVRDQFVETFHGTSPSLINGFLSSGLLLQFFPMFLKLERIGKKFVCLPPAKTSKI